MTSVRGELAGELASRACTGRRHRALRRKLAGLHEPTTQALGQVLDQLAAEQALVLAGLECLAGTLEPLDGLPELALGSGLELGAEASARSKNSSAAPLRASAR